MKFELGENVPVMFVTLLSSSQMQQNTSGEVFWRILKFQQTWAPGHGSTRPCASLTMLLTPSVILSLHASADMFTCARVYVAYPLPLRMLFWFEGLWRNKLSNFSPYLFFAFSMQKAFWLLIGEFLFSYFCSLRKTYKIF